MRGLFSIYDMHAHAFYAGARRGACLGMGYEDGAAFSGGAAGVGRGQGIGPGVLEVCASDGLVLGGMSGR